MNDQRRRQEFQIIPKIIKLKLQEYQQERYNFELTEKMPENTMSSTVGKMTGVVVIGV